MAGWCEGWTDLTRGEAAPSRFGGRNFSPLQCFQAPTTGCDRRAALSKAMQSLAMAGGLAGTGGESRHSVTCTPIWGALHDIVGCMSCHGDSCQSCVLLDRCRRGKIAAFPTALLRNSTPSRARRRSRFVLGMSAGRYAEASVSGRSCHYPTHIYVPRPQSRIRNVRRLVAPLAVAANAALPEHEKVVIVGAGNHRSA